MRRTKAEIYLHLVWATSGRLPLLTPQIEQAAYACVQQEAERLDCVVLAIGGMPDHVHLIVRVPTSISAARLAQQVKGVSSVLIREQLRDGERFRWQEGYGVFSLSRSHLGRVVKYVTNQKQHHAASRLWPEWETTDEEMVPPETAP